MDDYLAKPVRAAELLAAIDRVVPARGGTRPEDHSNPGLIDPMVVLAVCGGDAAGLTELCQDFRTYAPARLTAVRDALVAGDAAGFREAAHKLAGLLSAFSAVAGDVASEVETHAAHGRPDEARPLVERFAVLVPELTRQVDRLTIDDLRRQAGA